MNLLILVVDDERDVKMPFHRGFHMRWRHDAFVR
jgi:hypothetical protein